MSVMASPDVDHNSKIPGKGIEEKRPKGGGRMDARTET